MFYNCLLIAFDIDCNGRVLVLKKIVCDSLDISSRQDFIDYCFNRRCFYQCVFLTGFDDWGVDDFDTFITKY